MRGPLWPGPCGWACAARGPTFLTLRSFLSFEVPPCPSGWSDWRLLGQSERDWGAQISNMGPWTVWMAGPRVSREEGGVGQDDAGRVTFMQRSGASEVGSFCCGAC